MEINNINNNPQNFGRVIPVYQYSCEKTHTKSQQEETLQELTKVLNSKYSQTYNYSKSNKIRGFFKDILTDYNGKNGILLRKISKGDIVLISGKDAKDIEKLEKDNSKKRQEIKKNGNPRDLLKKTYMSVEREITKRIENGHSNRPESSITMVYSPDSDKSIVTAFLYSSIAKSYAKASDGHRTKNKVKANYHNAMATVTCQENELRI